MGGVHRHATTIALSTFPEAVRITAVTRLHTDVFGSGIPAVFVHGSFGWGLDTFPDQQALASNYRVVLIDRAGFGRSSNLEPIGWPADAEDLAELLLELGPSHLVGQSYGAVVALLAASARPDAVRSLVVIEPPLYGLAPDDPHVAATTRKLRPVFERAAGMSAAEFLQAWALATGMTEERYTAWTAGFGARDWSAVEASRRERWPGDAPVDLETLRRAPFPKVVVRGAWRPVVAGDDDRGKDFAAICEVLAERISGRLVVFDRSTHNPQMQEPQEFNDLLREVWSG